MDRRDDESMTDNGNGNGNGNGHGPSVEPSDPEVIAELAKTLGVRLHRLSEVVDGEFTVVKAALDGVKAAVAAIEKRFDDLSAERSEDRLTMERIDRGIEALLKTAAPRQA